MNVFATAGFTYAGLSRWQLWFDNPNKAAVLFASFALIALACFGAARSKVVRCLAVVLFACFGYALLHTFSRGGMLALGVGALVIVGCNFRQWRRYVALPVVIVGLALLPLGRNALGRLATSAPRADFSVGNRLVLWQTVPRMIADAPGGWGLGNSGSAFMNWYQPLERRETYRTMVGSHLTWLVEFGRVGRLEYIVGWLVVLGAGGVLAWRRRQCLPLALWACLGTASIFSSVAEAWELWVLPVMALVPVAMVVRTRRQLIVGARILGIASVLGVVLLAVLEYVGRRQSAAAELGIARDADHGQTVLSVRHADAWSYPWIVYDAATLGGTSFGHALRERAKSLPGRIWGVADTLDSVPARVHQLVLVGKSSAIKPSELARFPDLKELRVLSPAQPADWLSTKVGGQTPLVVCGEFSASCPGEECPGLLVVPGARDYLPDWPLYAFGQYDVK